MTVWSFDLLRNNGDLHSECLSLLCVLMFQRESLLSLLAALILAFSSYYSLVFFFLYIALYVYVYFCLSLLFFLFDLDMCLSLLLFLITCKYVFLSIFLFLILFLSVFLPYFFLFCVSSFAKTRHAINSISSLSLQVSSCMTQEADQTWLFFADW